MEWGCCKIYTEEDEFTCCSVCQKAFHVDCLQTQDLRGNVGSRTWKCHQCKKTIKGNNDDTLVRAAEQSMSQGKENPIIHRSKKRSAPSMSPESAPNTPLTREEVYSIFKEIIKEERAELLSALQTSVMAPVTSQIKEIKEDFKCFKQSMDFMSSQYEEIKHECKCNKEAVAAVKETHNELQETMSQFDNRMNQLEQQVRLRNVEIQCVPEKKNENLPAIVAKISEAVGCDITESNIERCTRIAKLDRTSDRPRSIVVHLDSRKSKDSFMACTAKFNRAKPNDSKLNTTHIGMNGERKAIYIMEHLSAANKALHAATRKKAKELGYKFVWVRDGKIFARKNEDSNFIVINSKNSLDKLT